VCTVAHLASKGPHPKFFTVLNTHLDHQSDEQRKVSASLLLIRARYEAATTKAPVFITGDFNSTPVGDDSGAYKIITGNVEPMTVNQTFAARFAVDKNTLPDFRLVDLRGSAPELRVGANFATFTGFNPPEDTSAWARIDFVFGGNNGEW
jgi:endonuclease/exonuclease/phosphatase family metal-dependent hydrolase